MRGFRRWMSWSSYLTHSSIGTLRLRRWEGEKESHSLSQVTGYPQFYHIIIIQLQCSALHAAHIEYSTQHLCRHLVCCAVRYAGMMRSGLLVSL